jgi:hypothetical protein
VKKKTHQQIFISNLFPGSDCQVSFEGVANRKQLAGTAASFMGTLVMPEKLEIEAEEPGPSRRKYQYALSFPQRRRHRCGVCEGALRPGGLII